MRVVTDLSKDKIYAVFDMLDVDHSGLLDFDEFYLLICILIAVRVSSTQLTDIVRVTVASSTGQAGEGVHLQALQDSV